MIFSKDVLINIFEESFKDKVQRIYDESSLTSFIGHRYRMEYNFLEGRISIHQKLKRIGVILISDDDIFSETDASSDSMYYVGLFELKLKKFIKLNQKKSRRKFISR